MKSKNIKPLRLIKTLEKYFNAFDKISLRYNLEKIKTIGDAYMAVAGVTELHPHAAIRSCLAALEIQEFINNEREIAIATKKDFWEIRIGIHMGPLVSGIIGQSKFTFDIWGDTVNIAARAESASKRNGITITKSVVKEVEAYFNIHVRGLKEIHKRGGTIEMFYLDDIKPEFSLNRNSNLPNSKLRKICGLPEMDFDYLRTTFLNKLKSLLPENLNYHDVPHTLNVEQAAMLYADLEGINDKDRLLLRTAVLFHDSGFIRQYENNEDFGIQIAQTTLPQFGYTEDQISIISELINVTKSSVSPKNLLERIMCDADHDYLGRPDYKEISKKLRDELEDHGKSYNDEEWLYFQLDFLEKKHQYYTNSAKNIRNHGKMNRINEIKKQLEAYN